MKKQIQSMDILHDEVSTHNTDKNAANVYNSSTIHSFENYITKQVADGVMLGVCYSLSAINEAILRKNNSKGKNKVILSLTLFALTGILIAYALRKKVFSISKKK